MSEKIKNILHIFLYIAALAILAIGGVKMIRSYSPTPGNIEVNKKEYDSLKNQLKSQDEIINYIKSDTVQLTRVQQDSLFTKYLERFSR